MGQPEIYFNFIDCAQQSINQEEFDLWLESYCSITYIRRDARTFLHSVALHCDVEDLAVRISEHKVLAG